MKLIVNPHKIEILKEPVNEKEIDITKCEFEFSDEITNNFVKDAYFTFKGETYKQIIQDNQCSIPYEVLGEAGQIEIGVVAYLVENEEEIKRYNPTPAYFNTWIGSLKEEYENTEPVTPTDKEQIEQMLSNIKLYVNKEGKITTISFTNTDGTTQTETLEDGVGLDYNWQGTSLGVKREDEETYQYVNLKGEKGDAGAIHMIIVQTLPTEDIDESAIYLVPLENPTEEGNNYAEYVYINNQWELLGKIGVHVDLTDYVKNTDYATGSKGGVIKVSSSVGTSMNNNGYLQGVIDTYANYQGKTNSYIISKGTLENVVTGKGLVSNTDYANGTTGGVFKTSNNYGTSVSSSGVLRGITNDYTSYQEKADTFFICKGTLENVLNNRIGDIQTLLDNLDIGSGVNG